jgi:Tfp pilus assembly protein PilV
VTTRGARHRPGGEEGFGLVEIMAATVVLMVVVVSLTNLLVDSLSAALLARQRETAAGVASNIVENAKALGASTLFAETPGSQPCSANSYSPVPVLTTNFEQCFTTRIDNTVFTVSPVVTKGPSAAAPQGVTVTVTWASAQHSYITSTNVAT